MRGSVSGPEPKTFRAWDMHFTGLWWWIHEFGSKVLILCLKFSSPNAIQIIIESIGKGITKCAKKVNVSYSRSVKYSMDFSSQSNFWE